MTNQVLNPIHRHKCLVTILSELKGQSEDRKELLEFKKKIHLKYMKTNELTLNLSNLKNNGYIGITRILLANNSPAHTDILTITSNGKNLLNSYILKFISPFVKYF